MYLLVSALLSFILISGVFGLKNISKIDVYLESPDEIYSNRPFPLKVTCHNSKKHSPSFIIRSLVAQGDILFPFVDSKKKSSRYFDHVFNGRGRHHIDSIHVCSIFPFSFFIRCRSIKKSFEFIALPEPRKCDITSYLHDEMSISGEVSPEKPGYHPEVISIREYVQGDPLKYINWKATAKTGKLKTKELSSPVDQPVMIDFNKVNIMDVEEKISCITHVIMQLHKKNVPYGLVISGKTFKPRVSVDHKVNILRELALYEA